MKLFQSLFQRARHPAATAELFQVATTEAAMGTDPADLGRQQAQALTLDANQSLSNNKFASCSAKHELDAKQSPRVAEC